jgi:catechol 2,3-dioxygenase-like lactoylglutathione lyase family enzyme
MSPSWKIVAFVPVKDTTKARPFYEGILGLRFVSEDCFALCSTPTAPCCAVSNVPADFKPQSFTILGWEVPDMEQEAAALREKRIHFEVYGFPGQDAQGIWSVSGGTKVARFKDPDGNLLSISQHP